MRLQNSRRGVASTRLERAANGDSYLLRQLSLHVWARLSHAFWQGTPSVTGHTRLQASFWLAQPAKQASVAASARRNLPMETLP